MALIRNNSLADTPLSPLPPLHLREHVLPMGSRTYLVGILNVTPDSFSDGGKYLHPEAACRHLEELTAGGVDIVDIGGESTRPGAAAVSMEEELCRLRPVLEAWAACKRNAILSIDTSKSEVAEAALSYGASLVNDVTALHGDLRMAEVVARHQAGLVLMHMKGEPRTMQENPTYDNLIDEIKFCFEKGIAEAVRAGVREESILLDPGIGFGKTVTHNLEILRNLKK
ncbi:MAG: dihydropteroate synthase, partial [Candidatus Omnitrophota bacterium]